MGKEKVHALAEESPGKKTIDARNADVTLRLLEEHGHEFGPLTEEKEKKLRRTIYWRLMTLLSAVNIVLFVRYIIRRLTRLRLTVLRSTNRLWDTLPSWACLRRLGSPRLSTTI